MKNILIIAKKEWLNYWGSSVGYIFAGLLLVVTSWLFFGDLFLGGEADIRPYFGVLTFLFSLFIPAIAMGLLADEKKNGTWEVVLSLPVSETEMVLGKFLGSAGYLLFCLGLTAPVIVTLGLLGRPDWGVVAGSVVGAILLGLAYLAVGLLASSLSNQAVVGFLGATAFLLLNNLLGQEVFLMKLPLELRGIFEGLSLSFRTNRFSSGLLTFSDVVFYLSWIVIFLILTVMGLKNRDK